MRHSFYSLEIMRIRSIWNTKVIHFGTWKTCKIKNKRFSTTNAEYPQFRWVYTYAITHKTSNLWFNIIYTDQDIIWCFKNGYEIVPDLNHFNKQTAISKIMTLSKRWMTTFSCEYNHQCSKRLNEVFFTINVQSISMKYLFAVVQIWYGWWTYVGY